MWGTYIIRHDNDYIMTNIDSKNAAIRVIKNQDNY